MSHFGNYIKERLDKHIIEDENGFATYLYENDYVYIEDIYVVKEKRKENIASAYADKIAQIAKSKGYDKMLGSVCPTAKGATTSLKVLLGYGFKVLSAEHDIIYFIKEI